VSPAKTDEPTEMALWEWTRGAKDPCLSAARIPHVIFFTNFIGLCVYSARKLYIFKFNSWLSFRQ